LDGKVLIGYRWTIKIHWNINGSAKQQVIFATAMIEIYQNSKDTIIVSSYVVLGTGTGCHAVLNK